MKWYTPIQMPTYPFAIDHQTSILAIGSCFAEHIAQRLIDLKFDVVLNPFGIVYNPASIQHCFSRLESGKAFTEEDLFMHDGLWHSFQHHGKFSAPEIEDALAKMNEALALGQKQWQKAKSIIVTLGTAWAYRHKASCQIVSNNHKQPQQDFDRELLTVEQIKSLLQSIIAPTLRREDPPQWLFSVSPVRHLKDGAIGNNRSKAHLLTAVHDLVDEIETVHYFPGYELLLDELRDYRFFASDHAHPSEEAIAHIWDQFGGAFFSESTHQLNRKLGSLQQAMSHRPLHPDTDAYRNFRAQQVAQIDQLSTAHPFLELSDWRSYFSG